MHEHQLRAVVIVDTQFARNLVDVASENRREIRIDDGGICTCDQFDQRTRLVAQRHLRKSDVPADSTQLFFVLRVSVTMHQCDGNRAYSVSKSGFEMLAGFGIVEFDNDITVDIDTFVNFDDLFVKH